MIIIKLTFCVKKRKPSRSPDNDCFSAAYSYVRKKSSSESTKDKLTNVPCNSIRSNSDEFFDLLIEEKKKNDEELFESLTVQSIFAPYLELFFLSLKKNKFYSGEMIYLSFSMLVTQKKSQVILLDSTKLKKICKCTHTNIYIYEN